MKEKNAKNVSLEAGWLHGVKAGFCGACWGQPPCELGWAGTGHQTATDKIS